MTTANTVAQAIEDKGYDVKIRDIFEVGLMYAALGEGSVDFYPDAWLPALQESYLEPYEDSIVVGGDLYGAKTPVGWAIPGYVADEYDIKSIDDLEGRGEIFDDRIIGYEAGTGGPGRSLEALDAYGLDDELELLSSIISIDRV